MKFDLIIGNPPYCRNLHLKLIQATLPHLAEDGEAVFIHPARWVEDLTATYKKNSDWNTFKDIRERMSGIKIIRSSDATELFHIIFTMDLMVAFYDLKLHSAMPQIWSIDVNAIKDKIMRYAVEHNLNKHIEKEKIDGIRVRVNAITKWNTSDSEYSRKAHITGIIDDSVINDGIDMHTQKTWTQKYRVGPYSKNASAPIPNSIQFPDQMSAENFIKSFNCDFYWNLVFLIKWGVNVPLRFLPWMGDYEDHVWTTPEYCKFFKLNGEETAFMSRHLDDYRCKDFIHYTQI